jgi:orotidine-5'-phosphate decarboxylase
MPPVSPVSPAASRLFLALDCSDLDVAIRLVDQTWQLGIGYKIGLELIHAGHGPNLVRYIRQKGYCNDIFYDPKLSDTPNTMKGAVRNVAGLFVDFFNVHASAGPDSVSAAASVKGDSKLLAVTILTTITPEQYYLMFVAPFLGISVGVIDSNVARAGLARTVVSSAKSAKLNGADGIVCSALELPMLMVDPETADLDKMVPGTRMPGADAHEQKRVGTPMKAMEDGGWEHTFLVIGREATEAEDPAAVLMKIMEAIMVYAPQ